MFPREVNTPKSRSYFLFGARGVGKSTLLRQIYEPTAVHLINLLRAQDEDRYSRNPDLLIEAVNALPSTIRHVVIDEVQKVPKLLDLVHLLIEDGRKSLQFVLTGSSARKLKRGQANLLAGRAFTRHLYPLTAGELGEQFSLPTYLAWGGMPEIWNLGNDLDRREYLDAYASTFIKEEIQAEQIVRQILPFRRFIEVAAQCNGKLINYAKIARDVGADPKTVKSYYEILVDTLLGFYVEPYHTSRRKRMTLAPKFYFFDPGVSRALSRHLDMTPLPGTAYYGELFENFVILEILKKSEYARLDYRLCYLRTEDQAEIDLVIERPNKKLALLEIKSKPNVHRDDLRHLLRFANDFPEAELFCLSMDTIKRQIDGVQCLYWQEGLALI